MMWLWLLALLATDPAREERTGAQIVAALVDAYNQRDHAAYAALLAEDARWLSVEGARIATQGEGRDAIAAWTRAYLETCRSCRSELTSVAESGRFVATVERASWTDAEDRCRQQISPAVYEVEDGQVQTVWYYPASAGSACGEEAAASSRTPRAVSR